jgi:iron complex transport system substrate-binding protein
MQRALIGAMVLLLGGASVEAAPRRVISADLCSDEYVFRLVPREHIVALSWLAGDTHPVVSTIASKVRGIALIRPLAEDILTRSPDLVVLYEGTNPRLRAQLAEAHVSVLDIPATDSLDGIRSVTRRLGRQLGAIDNATAMLAEMNHTLDAARAEAPARRVSTLVYEANGYATTGRLADEIMAAAGLADAAPGLNPTRSGTIPVEEAIALAPRILIFNRADGTIRSQADLVLHHPAFSALAGKTSVASLALTPLLCPGPWSVSVVPALARLGRDTLAHGTPQP